ncbi:MAG: hypothetical protein P1P89_22225 [Desulfobacterales bacterium]|nr:hypothetical protein [Desulfobacterales bacterium]
MNYKNSEGEQVFTISIESDEGGSITAIVMPVVSGLACPVEVVGEYTKGDVFDPWGRPSPDDFEVEQVRIYYTDEDFLTIPLAAIYSEVWAIEKAIVEYINDIEGSSCK